MKQKTCKICKEKFVPKFSTLEPVCQKYDCKVQFAMETHAKQKASKEKKAKQDNSKEKAILKEKLKTLSEYEAEAKKSFQHWIRLRDKDLPCISCNNPKPADWCGSHYFSAGVYSGLMFDERNCNGACNTYCNKYLSGNLLEYRKGLVKRYGLGFVEKLESEADEKRNYKYTKSELIAKKMQYDIKIKEFKCKQ